MHDDEERHADEKAWMWMRKKYVILTQSNDGSKPIVLALLSLMKGKKCHLIFQLKRLVI